MNIFKLIIRACQRAGGPYAKKYLLINRWDDFRCNYDDMGYKEGFSFETKKEVDDYLKNKVAKDDREHWILYLKV